jgi:type VI secretion system protein ImpF
MVPSVLDRLLDDDPGTRREAPRSRSQSLGQLKQSVRDDLQNLLNTRTRNVTWGPGLEELNRSLLNYGMPDFGGVNLASEDDRERFCSEVEAVIRQHEPRLLRVRVLPVTSNEPVDRTFNFRIEALLRAEPDPEHVTFDSVVKPSTGSVVIRGAGE